MPTNASTTVLRYPTSFETSTPVSPTPNASVTLSIRKDRRASFAGCRNPPEIARGRATLVRRLSAPGRSPVGFPPTSSADTVPASAAGRMTPLQRSTASPRSRLTSLLIGTVVAKNYLPFARVLARSLRRTIRMRGSSSLFRTSSTGMWIGAPSRFRSSRGRARRPRSARPGISFRPTRTRDRAQPYLIEHMAADAGSALFLDADTLVVGDLEPLFDSVQRHALTLVPHRLAPPATDGVARDLVLNLAGIFNGGVVGIRHRPHRPTSSAGGRRASISSACTPSTVAFTTTSGWLDLALGFVEDLHIHRDPGVNVAHWNLPERPIRIRDGAITAAGEPQVVHFSGFRSGRPKDAVAVSPRPPVGRCRGGGAVIWRLRARARSRRMAHRPASALRVWFVRQRRSDPRSSARLFAQIPDRAKFGDPFNATARNSYFNWLRKSPTRRRALRGPSRLWLSVHRQRADIRRAFQIDSTQTASRFWRGGARDAQLRTPPPDSHELGPDASQRMPRWP